MPAAARSRGMYSEHIPIVLLLPVGLCLSLFGFAVVYCLQ